MVLQYTELMVLVWTMYGVSVVVTVFRGASRWSSQRQLFADDYFVFFGLLSLTALSVVITKLLPTFYLMEDYLKALLLDPLAPPPLPLEEMAARSVVSFKLMFCEMLIFFTTLWSAKLSILFFFRRLLVGLPRYIKAWWVCFILVTMLYIACMLSNFLTCLPLNRYWSSTGCSDPADLKRADTTIKFATAADVTADALIMILPLNLLRKLQITPRQKFGLAVIFCLGSITIACAFARMVQVTKATGAASNDPTTIANGPVLLGMWSHIESSVSVIVATLPAFRSLLNGKLGRTHPRNYGSPAGGYNGGQCPESSGVKSKSKARRALSGSGWSQGDAIKLDSIYSKDERSIDKWGSQTGLAPLEGIKKQYDYTVTHMPRTPKPESVESIGPA